ncbi:MAG: M48 family metalloprotease [Hyphomicrobiales bacterium]
MRLLRFASTLGHGAAADAGRRLLAALLCALMIVAPVRAQAAGIIHDAEIESLMRDYAAPIFKAAGVGNHNINIHLIGSPVFNAFVIDGSNMFFFTGTLMKADTPNQVIGIIAHETGHIQGKHLSRLRIAASQARAAALMLQVLGLLAIGAGAAAGAGSDLSEAGTAIAVGGQSMVQRSFLAYQQSEESSADQAAVAYLNATGQSMRGMLETFQRFIDESMGSLSRANPYLQSHPLPQQRIAQLRELAKNSPYFDVMDPPELQLRHDLMRAKLSGFLEPPRTVFNKYPSSDKSLPARYARTIATYFDGGLPPFLPRVDDLIAAMPNNPFFHELKGFFLFRSGKADQAVGPFRKAVELAPKEGQIRVQLAQALLATDARGNATEAIQNLRQAMATESKNPIAYRQLAMAYGAVGRIGDADLASAHAYLYEGRVEQAKAMATRAKEKLSPSSNGWLQADDIIAFIPPKKN